MNQQFGQPQQPKKPAKVAVNDSILESLRSIGGGVGKTVVKDFAGKGASDALKSLFGTLPQQHRGEMKPDQSVDLTKEYYPPQQRRVETFVRPQVRSEDAAIKEKIDAVRMELKSLSQSVKELQTEITKAVTETIVDPGIYHLNFFERLRSILHIMRQQIDDSRTWLSTWNTRKKKMGFWGKYKKHGTQFGLSSERTMATQAG